MQLPAHLDRCSYCVRLLTLFCLPVMLNHCVRGDQPSPLRLVQSPVLSPDGKTIVFTYGGDLLQVSSEGGRSQPLTSHQAMDSQPRFSRDGKKLAFISDRDGQDAIYQMAIGDSTPHRVTFHSEGYQLQDWFPNNKDVLAIGSRDHFWRSSGRLIRVGTTKREKEDVLANAYASDASVSSDGKRVLLVREGERWWRKGYYGSRSAQIWLLDLETGEFQLVLSETYDCRWPRWIGDKNAFVFTRGMAHGFELCRFDLSGDQTKAQDATKDADRNGDRGQGGSAFTPVKGRITQLTDFGAESVVFPAVSGDGTKVVFRHLFDLYTIDLVESDPPKPNRVKILPPVDSMPGQEIRRTLRDAQDVTFTNDGLEMAFTAGGDLWVMDTKLREPKRVTISAGWDQSPVFSKDGKILLAILDVGGQKDIYRIRRGNEKRYWWQNDSFEIKNLTQDSAVESDLKLSPRADRMFFVRGRGDLVHTDLDGRDRVTLAKGFSGPDYDVSPDGRWVAFAQSNDDFNSEIYLIDSQAKRSAYNVSRHPDDDARPRFSPDGKLLAFTGRRVDQETDIYYVWLQADERDKSPRQRSLEEAIDVMRKSRKDDAKKEEKAKNDEQEEEADESADADKETSEKDDAKNDDDVEPLEIDFERLHERLQRISIDSTTERSLIWEQDGKRLAFMATIDGDNATYTVEFPDELKPKKFSGTTGRPVAWTKKSGGLLMLANGDPTLVKGNDTDRYSFTAQQKVDRGDRLQAGFDEAWRVMRDRWYDPKTGGRNWSAVRRKYRPVAATLPDENALGDLMSLMLGELNGSHLGFTPKSTMRSDSGQDWNNTTAHLGVRFDPRFAGPGLQIRDVIVGGPADKADSRLFPGEIILSIDGVDVDIDMDLTSVLNGRLSRDIHLVVTGTTDPVAEDSVHDDESESGDKSSKVNGDDQRNVVLRPISFSAARSLLYDTWIELNRSEVHRLSNGKLGYLHIRAMNMSSFYEFERQLYAAGYGRLGLVIDVRENGGGSTTDLLLTSLTQPTHATTVPRGGGPGYPQSRLVYASWNKPIIVLCNQNSYSNAEIFSHAIKSLGRGRLVGVPTAGGVISTGSVSITDVGTMRMPFRGWFLTNSGVDMEMAGAQPDTIVWPRPGEIPSGVDRQLSIAVGQLLRDVAKANKSKAPNRVYATERDPPAPKPELLK